MDPVSLGIIVTGLTTVLVALINKLDSPHTKRLAEANTEKTLAEADRIRFETERERIIDRLRSNGDYLDHESIDNVALLIVDVGYPFFGQLVGKHSDREIYLETIKALEVLRKYKDNGIIEFEFLDTDVQEEHPALSCE
jgi:hypothetical protein